MSKMRALFIIFAVLNFIVLLANIASVLFLPTTVWLGGHILAICVNSIMAILLVMWAIDS